jgi:hypothetical protein
MRRSIWEEIWAGFSILAAAHQKGRLIYLLRLYEVIPPNELSGLRGRIEEELLIKPLRNNDHGHFRRLSEAIRDRDKLEQWSPVQWAVHFVFLACSFLEHQQQPLDRATVKDLALKLWAQQRINERPGQYISNVLDLSPSESAALERELKENMPSVAWHHVWENTGLKEREAG